MSTEDRTLNVYQRIHAVMLDVEYVQKDVEIKNSGKGVARDAVVAALRKSILKHRMVVLTTQVAGQTLPSAKTSSSGTPLTVYEGEYATWLINIDDPKDVASVKNTAHGNDYGDKSPGKARTYAEKINLLGMFFLETGIADEGRNADEGDDEERPSKPAIRRPESKSGDPVPNSVPSNVAEEAPAKPASKGMLKQIKSVAELKGISATVVKHLKDKGFSGWNGVSDTVAREEWKWVQEQPEVEEPGSNG